ncbi:hypothetical protein JYT60_01975 [bacterium AH-315-C08]|nr:hypothetical protein [bacterium AH-315-C08]
MITKSRQSISGREDFRIAQITLATEGKTFYIRHGDVFSWACLFATGLIAFTAKKKKN